MKPQNGLAADLHFSHGACSTVLPIPYAMSKIGLLVGLLTMAVVAAVNDATCCMLIRASAATGHYSYESLAEWAGGKRAKVRAIWMDEGLARPGLESSTLWLFHRV